MFEVSRRARIDFDGSIYRSVADVIKNAASRGEFTVSVSSNQPALVLERLSSEGFLLTRHGTEKIIISWACAIE